MPPQAPRPAPHRPGGLWPLAALLILAMVLALTIWPSSLLGAAEPAGEAPFELHAGDRVVLLGDAIIEREGERGAIETALVATHPGAHLTFRNLGWSGDTVWAESRGVFDAPSAGYARLLDLVHGHEATVVIIAYGRNESFAGAAGLAPFRAQLSRLCRDLRGPPHKAGAAAATRLVLVTPPPFEATAPLSSATAATRNAALADYAAAIREVAVEEGAGIVDLFSAVKANLPAGAPLTENGVHLSAAGYDAAAAVFAAAAGRPLSGDFAGRTAAIRAAVNEKNRLFFHRWRPANETSLFLFRRHEQGNNAVEIPQFDPLVEAAEAKVRKLAQESP